MRLLQFQIPYFQTIRLNLKKIQLVIRLLIMQNSAIVKAGNSSGLKISKCTGLVNNDDKYKVKTKLLHHLKILRKANI